MPTEELEHELRRAFASAAAGYQHSEQARQRLLQRNYQPGSSHRRLIAGITAVASAGSVALGLGLSGVLGAAPARSTGTIGTAAPARTPGTIRTAAFTLTSNANGTDTLTLTESQMLNPAALQQALAQHGIKALVKTDTYCSSSPAAPDPGSIGVLTVQHANGTPLPNPSPAVKTPANFVPAENVTVINPAAMPTGTELFFDYVHSDHGLLFDLIYTGSYTCSNGQQPPATP
jgi:hypothetical protein